MPFQESEQNLTQGHEHIKAQRIITEKKKNFFAESTWQTKPSMIRYNHQERKGENKMEKYSITELYEQGWNLNTIAFLLQMTIEEVYEAIEKGE